MSLLYKLIKSIAFAGIGASVILFNGCISTGSPRPRCGSYPAAAFGTKFLDAKGLGKHSYWNGLSEHNGLVYTSKGGHIDIAHLRIAADNTRYLYNKTNENIINGETEFTFKLNVEPSLYYVTLRYPEYWSRVPQEYREKIANKVSLELSQYFTYTMTTWHEVLTWFGFKCLFFMPEKLSAFSWEDIYSNLLGTRLGAQALADDENGFNRAMTILLKDELEKLQVQSRSTARQAARQIKDKRFDGQMFRDMTRSMDIGLNDGLVTPVLAPGIREGMEPESYPVPRLDLLTRLGFSMTLEIEPKEFVSGKIMKIIYPAGGGKRIQPAVHLPIVMDYIKKDALRQGFAVRPTETLQFRSEQISKAPDSSSSPNL